MIQFETSIEKFGEKGEKTGWTYLSISFEIAEKINEGVRKSYNVKGKIDDVVFSQIAILPMGEGNFILPIKADFRKKLRKGKNDRVFVQLELDTSEYLLNESMMVCLQEEKLAFEYFNTFPNSHKKYYSKWVDGAKTESTKAKRIARIIYALCNKMSFAEMLRNKDIS